MIFLDPGWNYTFITHIIIPLLKEINSSLQSLTERMTDQSRQMESLMSALDGFKHTLKTIKVSTVEKLHITF